MRRLKKGLRINKEQLLLFLLVLPQLKPESFDYVFPNLDMIFNIGRVLSFFVVILLYIAKRRTPGKIMYAVFFLQLWVTITTILNQGDIQRAIFTMVFTVVIVSTIDLFSMKSVIPSLMMNFEWLIYANLATLLLFPQGLYRHGVHSEFIDYFLGFKNAFFSYCLVSILLAVLNYIINKKHIRSILLILASFLTVIIAWSASAIISLVVTLGMFICLIIIQRPRCLQRIQFQHIFIISVVVNILVAVFNVIANSSIISNIIQNVLHKEITLSGRTVIWGIASKMIAEKPFIGYGIGEHITWAGYDWYGHNQYYEMLMEGGMPCLILFIAIVYLIGKKLSSSNNKLVRKTFIVVFSGLFTFFLTEAGNGVVFYILYVVAFHSDSISSLADNRLRCPLMK